MAPRSCLFAVNPDHVDIVWPGSNALFDNFCAFVDHGVERSFEDLLIGNGPSFYAYLLRMPDDKPFNQRIGGVVSLVVVRIKTSVSLLPVAQGLQTPSSLANTGEASSTRRYI